MFAESLLINGPIMIWVGFMGGAAYVNVMHNILDLPSLKKEEREVFQRYLKLLQEAM